MGDSETIRNHAAFIWSVADLLRGDYKQSEYGKVVLPLTVIRRLDCVLEPTKQAVLEKHKELAGKIENVEPVLQAVAGEQFYNTSPLTFTKLLDDPNSIADSLALYIGGDRAFTPSRADLDVVDAREAAGHEHALAAVQASGGFEREFAAEEVREEAEGLLVLDHGVAVGDDAEHLAGVGADVRFPAVERTAVAAVERLLADRPAEAGLAERVLKASWVALEHDTEAVPWGDVSCA